MKNRYWILVAVILGACLIAAVFLTQPRWSEIAVVPMGYAAPDDTLHLIYESAPSSRAGGNIILGAQVQYAGYTEGRGISNTQIRKVIGTDVSKRQPFEIQFGHDIHAEGMVVKGYWQKRYTVTQLSQSRTDGTEERTVTVYVPVEPLLQLHYYESDGEMRLLRIEHYAYFDGSYSITGAEQFP